MHVAVIGGGLAGLSSAFFLQKIGATVTLYRKKDDMHAASLVASGLLHPYPGPSGKKSKFADEGMRATRDLIFIAESALGQKVALDNGILRKGWENAPDEVDIEKISEGHLIRSAVTVYMSRYLEGLEKSILGLKVIEEKIDSLDELSEFELIVVAAGEACKKFFPFLPVSHVKGQILTATHPSFSTQRSIIGKGHISPLFDQKWHIGSTYEHHYQSVDIDIEKAKSYLSSRISQFFPPLESFDIHECRSGIRVSPKGTYLPIVQEVSPGVWVFTGLGSRGLLYHAYYGRYLAKMIQLSSFH